MFMGNVCSLQKFLFSHLNKDMNVQGTSLPVIGFASFTVSQVCCLSAIWGV